MLGLTAQIQGCVARRRCSAVEGEERVFLLLKALRDSLRSAVQAEAEQRIGAGDTAVVFGDGAHGVCGCQSRGLRCQASICACAARVDQARAGQRPAAGSPSRPGATGALRSRSKAWRISARSKLVMLRQSVTRAPAARSASTPERLLPPVVTMSSTSNTCRPATFNSPSMRPCRPCPLCLLAHKDRRAAKREGQRRAVWHAAHSDAGDGIIVPALPRKLARA